MIREDAKRQSALISQTAKMMDSANIDQAGKHSFGNWLPSTESVFRPCSFATPVFTECASYLEFTFTCNSNYHIAFIVSIVLCNIYS